MKQHLRPDGQKQTLQGSKVILQYRTVSLGDTIPIMVGRPDVARGRVNVRFYRERSKKPRKQKTVSTS